MALFANRKFRLSLKLWKSGKIRITAKISIVRKVCFLFGFTGVALLGRG
jgi:hypothetical protein